MVNLFLDDCPNRTKAFTEKYPNAISTTTSKSMIALLKLPIEIKYLFLDHDLYGDVLYDAKATTVGTGMEVVEWLEKNKRTIHQIIIHSHNGDAAPIMQDRLTKAGYWVAGYPFWGLLPQLGRE